MALCIVQLYVYGLTVDSRIGVREAQDAALWAWSCHNQHFRPHPLDLGIEMGVVRL